VAATTLPALLERVQPPLATATRCRGLLQGGDVRAFLLE